MINIKEASVYIFGIRIVNAFISFLVIPLSVKYFGISEERDIWILTSAFIGMSVITFFGPINDTFRAKFVSLREQYGSAEVIKKLQSLLMFILMILIVLCLFVIIFNQEIKNIIAPVVTEEEASTLFKVMLYLILPTMVINQIATIGVSTLNTYAIYYIPEIVGVLSGIMNLLCIILLSPLIGIFSLIVPVYISSLVLFMVVIFFFIRLHINVWNMRFRFSWNDVKPFVYFALPFFFSYSIGLISNVIEKRLTNQIGLGTVSILDYARRFPQMIQSVLSSVLASVMIPVLSSAYAKNNQHDFFIHFKSSLQIVLLIISFSVALLVGASEPLCKFFFYKGNVTIDTIDTITILLKSYTISFIGIAFCLFFSFVLLSEQKSKILAFFGSLISVIMIILNFILVGIFGIYTFAITLFLSHAIISVIMYITLHIENNRVIILEIVKYLSFTIVATTVLFIFNRICYNFNTLFQLMFSFLLLLLFFAGSMKYLMGVNIITFVKRRLYNKF